ncbi:hypothetical protein GCE86_08615 [Micromonospora terminaliae]|uniref:AroM family protein n=1 Tax=Micromonospora terminaliae TaxID=1914461 RepID=A0AAJ2ZDH3_9ACTN|nr:hypothetical protein [Micromonospora terminaliae]NES28152.1 AroM family protein [Micromonospora terminaliae]QGL47105.1 hypothetical protein GCE86_08615 [Micromonospora terminaliae]
MHLPENASEYDAGVVNGGLRDDELEWFRRQRRDLEAERGGDSHDAEDLVGRHAVNVVPARWWQRDLSLPFDEEAFSVTSLSRDDVTAEARRCRESGNWLPLLVVSFAWGWGSRGFGPTRLSWVMRGGWRSPRLGRDEIERRLGAAIDVLDREGAPSAYDLLLTGGRIPALGPAFFTKFLYFASRSQEVRCPAPILDARLASAMRCFWTRRSDEPYAVGGRPARWLWQGPRWSTYRYRVYRAFLGRAAAQLSEAGERWTPDLVELLLFRGGPCEVN